LRWENSSVRAELEWIRKEYEQLHSQNASLKVGELLKNFFKGTGGALAPTRILLKMVKEKFTK
jgi:hypothetical protein